MLNLFSLRGRLSWKLGASGDEKVVLSAVDVESLRSEIAALEERESHFKAQLEHIDEILRSARLSGYLHLRMRWAALPGEPDPIDDTEVDDWLPRFLVLHGSCIYLYMMATDLSPQDSTLLSDVVEIGRLPCLTREDEETRHCFYILTRQGLRYECSSTSKIQEDPKTNQMNSAKQTRISRSIINLLYVLCFTIFKPLDFHHDTILVDAFIYLHVQVDSWLAALQIDCKLALFSDDLDDPKL